MRALAIIASEHRNMWRVTNALGALSERLGEKAEASDLHTVVLIADYLDGFSVRFHHPKESGLLFSHIRRRSNEAGSVLDRLDRDHAMTPGQVHRIRDLASKTEPANREGIAALIREIALFSELIGGHMTTEEEVTFPIARKVLTRGDWAEIDAAFEAHKDPLDEEGGQGEIELLRARIAQLLPAPEGLAGHAGAVTAHLSPRALPHDGTLLEVEGLTCRYGRIEAIRGIDIRVGAGQLVALVGANGAGKTTLLRCISGVQSAASGTIRLGGVNLNRHGPDARVRAGIAQVPEGRQVFAPMSIRDNLIMGAYTRPAAEIPASLDEVYGLFPFLRERRSFPAGMLSGGQQQMLAVGRALMSKPKLLLMDEPSMGLAPLIVEEIFRVVKMLREAGITILLVEQNARAALAIADHAYVLETGTVTLEGSGPELLHNDEVRRAYLGM